MDFAMNFNNWYQDEVQSAYWTGTQTTIHGTINFFKCDRKGCSENVTLALVHITDDMKHNSFLSRAAQNMGFKYLADQGIPLDLIIQFCDNCAAQYKSRRPFVELAKCPLDVIRVYFGEKHGKSHADGLFGRLKAWMSYQIKSRKFVVKDAQDFLRYCKEFYQTPRLDDCCQHYQVEFQFIRPSDIRRHQDADLDEAVHGTHDLYSVRNTAEPLTLKVHSVPCLCLPCIEDNGEECLNSAHTDPWRLVNLIPSRGANLRKYQKRKRPEVAQIIQEKEKEKSVTDHLQENTENQDIESDDESEITIDYADQEPNKRRERTHSASSNHVTDVTDSETDKRPNAGNDGNPCAWRNINEEIGHDSILPSENIEDLGLEEVEMCERCSKEIELAGDNLFTVSVTPTEKFDLCTALQNDEIPECLLWTSILSAFQSCTDFDQLKKLVNDINELLPPLKERVDVTYCRHVHQNDTVTQSEIPMDGPVSRIAVQTIGDGNCLVRSLGIGYFNDDSTHIELRVRIVIEGVIHMDSYLSHACLERGATYLHSNAELPTIFVTFSEFYIPGQQMNADTIQYIYCMEIYSCAKLGTYMGLWQLAQASSVLGIPLHTIYPVHGKSTLRNDFNRMFFPVEYPPTNDDDPIVIMWTAMTVGAAPIHFVPLLE